jgi:Zn-dependent peptidase ImmA (M78 family)
LRHGFKAHARRTAVEVRAELGLGPYERLDPYVLAAEYGIPIYAVSRLAASCDPAVAAWVNGPGRGVFSAALVPIGTGRFIIDNDLHAATRRASSIAHEMAHILCDHEFTEALITAEGCRAASREDENQAEWLGGELLITEAAALAAARNGWDDQQVADAYGVSPQRAAMRMNASGARLRVQRERAARTRARS